MYRFCVNINFHLSVINSQEYNCFIRWQEHVYVLRTCQTVLQSGFTIVQFHWQLMSDPVPLNPPEHLVLSVLFQYFDSYIMIFYRGFNFTFLNCQ